MNALPQAGMPASTERRCSLDRVIVCAPQHLWADATASLLQSREITRRTFTATSTTGLLSGMREHTDLAIAFDLAYDDAADLFEALEHRGSGVPVLCVLPEPDVERVAQLLELGAAGAVERDCPVDQFCRAVLDAALGRLVLPAQHRFDVMETIRQHQSMRHTARRQLSQLSQRERVVLRQLARGKCPDQIAGELLVSVHTVRACIRALGDKLGVRGQLRLASVGRELYAAAHAVSNDHLFVQRNGR